jgi:O-antigen/teichoic acid export membrane protein
MKTRLTSIGRRLWKSRAARNAAASYFAFASAVICGLISIPITVRYLDKSEIGLWAVVSNVVAYLLWLDLGVGEATGRKMAYAIARNDAAEANRWWTTSITVLAFQGAVMFTIALIILPLLATFLGLDNRLATDARFLFFGMAAVSAIGMPVRAYPGILLAQERFYWVSIGQGVMPWVQLVVFAALLHGGFGIRSYLVASIVSSGVAWALFVVLAHRGSTQFAFDRDGLTRDRLGSLFRYSGSIAVMGITTTIMQSLPTLMLARLGGLAAVPVYSFTNYCPSMLRGLTARTAHSFFPKLQRMYVTGDRERFAEKSRAINLFAIGMSLIAAGCILVCNRSIVEWVAHRDFYAGAKASGWMAVCVITLTLLSCFTDMLQISGSMGRIALLNIMQLGAGVFCTWLGFHWAGLPGLVAVTALVPLAFQGPYALLRGSQNCGLDPQRIAYPVSVIAAVACMGVIMLSTWVSGFSNDSPTISLLDRPFRLPTAVEWAAGLVVAVPGAMVVVRQILLLGRL